MIRLLGARKFIDLPAGTLYVEYWLKTVEECEEMIDRFKKNPKDFLETEDLMIYQDNGSSLVIDDECPDGKFIAVDINVVGDAQPENTLRVVFDIEDIPDDIIYYDPYENKGCLKKEKLLEVVEKTKSFSQNITDWEHERLDALSNNGNKIVDVYISESDCIQRSINK